MSICVDKKLEKYLPQARLFKVSFSKFWCSQLVKWLKREVNSFGYIAPKPKMYFKIRCANFTSVYIGPICFEYRSKWLYFSALTLYKDTVNQFNNRDIK